MEGILSPTLIADTASAVIPNFLDVNPVQIDSVALNHPLEREK